MHDCRKRGIGRTEQAESWAQIGTSSTSQPKMHSNNKAIIVRIPGEFSSYICTYTVCDSS